MVGTIPQEHLSTGVLVNVPTTAELLSLTGMLKIKPPNDFSLRKYHAQ